MKSRQLLLGLFALTCLCNLSADEPTPAAPNTTVVQEDAEDTTTLPVKKVNSEDTDDCDDDCEDDSSSTDSN
ncbi:hypothetical protein [Rhabdochlamydiaceae symbiont of Dictyostelium giganteum]|uniref:hypothetical protein n=1 Tax=Rhabdochlamydiaceae symbiont of Dictyostelium giganteum TaxID=3342349 RepID=UPI00384B0537